MRRIIANQTLEIKAMKNVVSNNGWGFTAESRGEGVDGDAVFVA